MARVLGFLWLLAAVAAHGDIAGCVCDPEDAASLKDRTCSLTREALAQPESPAVFFLKDINPNKPNRMLALPRRVHRRVHTLADLTARERTQLWTEAISKAKELWGEEWGLAFNGDEMRTQCHPHVHIGKFLKAADREGGSGGRAGAHPGSQGRNRVVGAREGRQASRLPGRGSDRDRAVAIGACVIEIKSAATNENCVIHLHPRDNVAIARVPLEAARLVRAAGREVKAAGAVPAGHKIALAAIDAGGEIVRYGQSIGRAAVAIGAGEHVHVHNLRYEEPRLTYEFPSGEITPPPEPKDGPKFRGYLRADGRAGTRNYIAVVAASNCAGHVAERIARRFEDRALPPNVDGVVAFPHEHGCAGLAGRDGELLRRTISGVLDHPNVFAALLLGVGCETNQVAPYLSGTMVETGRLVGMTMQQTGGTPGIIEAAVAKIESLLADGSRVERVELPASKIVLGLNCGGSDSFSGITANPALGVASDLLVALGGTTVLAETPEIFGAEHLLVKRAASRAVGEKLLGFIDGYKKYVGAFGGTMDDNPAAGNKEGGLSNIVEKSLGAVAKGGDSPMMDVIDFSERIVSRGLVFMNTPGYDPVSLTGLGAGGVNLIAFTTGRGTGIGFPTVPVLKIATNSETYRAMRENMDLNAGVIADGAGSVAGVGREILDALLRVASGEKTASERWGHREFVPWRCGPVM